MDGPYLEQELKTFEAEKERLLGQAAGEYVLIKGTDVLGVFADVDDALREGYRRFRNQEFLVKQILEVEAPLVFMSPQFEG